MNWYIYWFTCLQNLPVLAIGAIMQYVVILHADLFILNNDPSLRLLFYPMENLLAHLSLCTSIVCFPSKARLTGIAIP